MRIAVQEVVRLQNALPFWLSLLLVPVSGLKPLMRGANGAVLSTVTLRLVPVALVIFTPSAIHW